MSQLKRDDVQFALIAADSLLARDKLTTALRCFCAFAFALRSHFVMQVLASRLHIPSSELS